MGGIWGDGLFLLFLEYIIYFLRKDKDGCSVPWVSHGVMKKQKMFHLLRAAGAFFLLSSMLFVSYHLIIDYDPSPYFVRKSKVVKEF